MRLAFVLFLSAGLACAAEKKTPARAGERPLFLTGGDISALPKLESLGAVYKDGGQAGDALAIMRKHGSNCFRVRLFVNPTMGVTVWKNGDVALFDADGRALPALDAWK